LIISLTCKWKVLDKKWSG